MMMLKITKYKNFSNSPTRALTRQNEDIDEDRRSSDYYDTILNDHSAGV